MYTYTEIEPNWIGNINPLAIIEDPVQKLVENADEAKKRSCEQAFGFFFHMYAFAPLYTHVRAGARGGGT